MTPQLASLYQAIALKNGYRYQEIDMLPMLDEIATVRELRTYVPPQILRLHVLLGM